MKKALSLLLASLGCLALSGCDEGSSERISVWNSISRGEPLPDVVLSLDLAKRQRIDEACINVRVGHSPAFWNIGSRNSMEIFVTPGTFMFVGIFI